MHPDAKRPQRRRVISTQFLVDHVRVLTSEAAAPVRSRNVDSCETGGGDRLLQLASPRDQDVVALRARVIVSSRSSSTSGSRRANRPSKECSNLSSERVDIDHIRKIGHYYEW